MGWGRWWWFNMTFLSLPFIPSLMSFHTEIITTFIKILAELKCYVQTWSIPSKLNVGWVEGNWRGWWSFWASSCLGIIVMIMIIIAIYICTRHQISARMFILPHSMCVSGILVDVWNVQTCQVDTSLLPNSFVVSLEESPVIGCLERCSLTLKLAFPQALK